VVELTDEREQHIAERHPDLLPEHSERIPETLITPDRVRRSVRFRNTHLLSRWFGDILNGKHVVVVVASESGPSGRHWVMTAYLTRRLSGGEIEWEKS